MQVALLWGGHGGEVPDGNQWPRGSSRGLFMEDARTKPDRHRRTGQAAKLCTGFSHLRCAD